MVVFDLGSLPSDRAPIAAAAVAGALWEQRPRRGPTHHRDRRGPQPVPTEPDRPESGLGDRARYSDRRRGPQVRSVLVLVDAAALEGAPERAVTMRQPDADEDELGHRHSHAERRPSRTPRPRSSSERQASAWAKVRWPARSRPIRCSSRPATDSPSRVAATFPPRGPTRVDRRGRCQAPFHDTHQYRPAEARYSRVRPARPLAVA